MAAKKDKVETIKKKADKKYGIYDVYVGEIEEVLQEEFEADEELEGDIIEYILFHVGVNFKDKEFKSEDEFYDAVADDFENFLTAKEKK